MQQDSVHISNSGHITYNNVVTQEPSKKYIQCSQCALTFKTKVFLFEHLNQVHCYDVDTALKNAGLKAAGTNKASTEEKSSNSGSNCKCMRCDFETHSWEVLHEHEKECPKKYENQDVIKNVTISENPKTEFHLTSQEAAAAEEIILIIPTSETTKELKTYKRPLQTQTITKFLVRTSESTEKRSDKLADGPEPADDTPGTLLFQKSPSESSPNSSGVLKVTAKPTIDVVKRVSDHYLLNHCPVSTDLQLSNSKAQERTIFAFPKNSIKKTSDKSFKSSPTEKAQFGKEETTPQKNAITSEQQSSDKSLLLEFSEDEEEKQLTRSEKTRTPERLQLSHDNARSLSMEVKSERSPQRPTSLGAKVALHYCSSCEFRHKSAVVMHVHYQKSHPETKVTLDKIKQTAHVVSPKTSKMTPDKSPNFVPTAENTTPKKPNSDTFELSPNKCEPSKQTENPPPTPENASETSNHVKPTKTKKAESAEDKSGKKSLSVKRKKSSGAYNSSDNSNGPLLYCKYCNYSNTNLRSVVGHHNAKHYTIAVADTVDILAYNAEMRQKGNEKEAEPTPVTASSTFPASPAGKKAKLHQNEKRLHEEEHKAESNPYAQAEKLYYCQKCNYGNLTANRVLNHQAKLHHGLKTNLARVIKHTNLMRNKIKTSNSSTKEFSFCTNIPLPFISESDEDSLFCNFCNYRHPNIQVVLRHYSQSHQGFELGPEEIRKYSSMLLVHMKKSQQSTAASQTVSQTSLETTGKPKKKAEKLSRGSASRRPFNAPRILQCPECTYSTRYVYILKKHLKKIHRSSHSVKGLLKICLDQGNLQPGYHCELCVFSHERALGLYEHYRDGHPGCKQTLAYVIKKLYAGPEKEKSEIERNTVIPSESSDDSNDEGGSAVSERSRQQNSTIYSCRACLFKCGSLPTLTDHYRAVHPWSVKEDGSVLDVIDANDPSNLTDICQQTLEFDEDPHDLSYKEFRCPLCPSVFPSLRGLKTHCGIKHPEANSENIVKAHGQPNPGGAHVFQCQYCTYVSTKHLGVIVHCQMRHPNFKATARSHYINYSNMRNWRDCLKKVRRGFRLSGFMCRLCPQIYVSLKKLSEHSKKFHNDTDEKPKVPKGPKSTASKKALKTKRKLNSQSSVSKASYFNKKQVKCQHCSFSCSTKLALNRHLRICHMDMSVSVSPDRSYQCALCSNLYFIKKNLAEHYVKRHGKEAYLKYCVQLQENEATSKTDQMDKKKLVYRCPRCCYVNASYYGTLTHCQMMHPDVKARADQLQTHEIDISEMMECTLGKGSNVRGFMCKKCPQIHKSLKQLKAHCRVDHKQATSQSQDQMVTEKQPQLEVSPKTTKTSSTRESVSEQFRNLTQSAESADTRPSNNASEHNEKPGYKCHICTYIGSCRKYLHSHYRKTHRIDAFTTYKLLAKYNQRKRFQDLFEAQSGDDAPVDCKLCPDLKFETSQMLIDHYRSAHSVGSIVDFFVLCQPSKRTTGLYRCAHCLKQMNGIRKLCLHLDRHRGREMDRVAEKKPLPVSTTATETAWPVLPTLETVEDLAQWNVAPVDTFVLPQSLLSSPSKPADPEPPETPSKEDNFSCKQCRRVFNSLKGLRLHERSHAALASIMLKHVSAAKHNTDKYLLFKQGTIRPFLCSICSFRTTSMSLWKCHFLKRHNDVIMDSSESNDQVEESAEMVDIELPQSLDDSKSLPEVVKEPDITKKSLYLEPRDVQRQLSHYSLMAQAGAPSEGKGQEPKLLENSQLFCDICDFSTEHQSSIRRHYLNRHGKKLLKCKDCSFFTGSKKTLEKHIDTGHTTYQSEPTHQRDIRCPFCLYQTKNKNNMIDHIILHRDERVAPIEVRRPKLSRYLQGVVFRCHKCTFTSGSADNLRTHMMRHDDIKPYKCRLCYFDCSQLSYLEAHLSDKHQVLRNHELVGQVNLHQLEASGSQTPEEEEETSSTAEYQEYRVDELVAVKIELQPHEEQDENSVGNDCMGGANRSEENSAKSSVLLEIQGDNTAVKCEDSLEEVFTVSDAARTQGMGIRVEQEPDEETKAGIQFEDFDCPETERQMDDHQAESMLTDTLPQQKIEGVEHGEVPVTVQTHEPHTDLPKLKILDTAAKVDDVVPDVLGCQDVSIHKIHTKADHDRAVKTRQTRESDAEDALLNEIFHLDGENGIPSVHNSKSEGALSISVATNHIQAVRIRTQQQYVVERHLLPLGPSCRQPKMSHQGILGASLASYNDKQVPTRKNSEESNDSYGEMPVLENEYLKGEMYPLESCEDEDESDDLEQEQDKEDGKITEADEEELCPLSEEQDADQMELDENPHMPKDALELTDPATTKDVLFTCEFCGRKFMSSCELERHITRHGM